MLKELKEFARRGNVVDMAVGIVIGAAFGAIVKSLVSDILMPPIGLVLGNVDFSNMFIVLKSGSHPSPYASLADASSAGAVTFNYGLFVNSIIGFAIVTFAMFIIIKNMNRIMKKEEAQAAEPTTKACNYCFSTIPIKAVRCPQCTSELKSA